LSVDKIKSTKCRVLTCRRVVGGNKKSVDELLVDGLSPHRFLVQSCPLSACFCTTLRCTVHYMPLLV